MHETEHYHLKKPEDTDFVRVSDLNGNADAIDAKLHELATEVTPIARGGTGATDAAAARTNLGLDYVLSTRSTQGPAYGPLASVTAEGHAEQDSTTGKNLLPNNATSQTINGITFTVNADGSVTCNGTSTAQIIFDLWNDGENPLNGTYTLSGCPAGGAPNTYGIAPRVDGGFGPSNYDFGNGAVITGQIDRVLLTFESGISVSNLTFYPQIEAGSTATPYEPYTGGKPSPNPDYPQEIRVVRGHEVTGKTGRYVDLVVTADGKTTTTPIPLPSRGWVGSLPDGTHDALSIDGAGKVTWELADAEVVLNANASENWQYESSSGGFRLHSMTSEFAAVEDNSVNLYASHFQPHAWGGAGDGTIRFSNKRPLFVYSGIEQTRDAWRTWLQANPVTVLYPLATPTTVDVGYVDLPDIPEGAVVSMPELEGFGVESWTSDAVARYVRAWAARS